MIKFKKYKQEIYIFLFLSLTAVSWQFTQLLIKFYANEYLPQTIYIQGVVVFGSFIFSLGLGTHIRFLSYQKRMKDIRVSFKIIHILTLSIFIIALLDITAIIFFGIEENSFPLLATIALLTLFSFYSNYAISLRKIKILFIFSISYIIYTICFIFIAVSIKTHFNTQYSLKLIYSIISLSGSIYLLLNVKYIILKIKLLEIVKNIKESFSFFYIALPIRILLFLLTILISKIGKIDLELTEIFIYSQILSSFVKFFISRIFIILEKLIMQHKNVYLVQVYMGAFFIELCMYIILYFIIGRHTLVGYLLIVLFLNILIYGYIKKFLSSYHKFIESSILLFILLPIVLIVIYAPIHSLLYYLTYLLLFLNIIIVLLTIKKSHKKYML